MTSPHQFHIPVMGLAFTIDSPIKVAQYGINSAISIIQDNLVESMRRYYYGEIGETYLPITSKEYDYRARRITDYLNLVDRIVQQKFQALHASAFEAGSAITQYFEMLPDSSELRQLYKVVMKAGDDILQKFLRKQIVPGAIEVNIMTKVDKDNFNNEGEVIPDASDAIAALRGYAKSNLANSAIVFSAGLNPRLFNYLATLDAFNAKEWARFDKRIVIKVSDYRSALIQGKYLAKKGLWVSEFRIESGLNCGGHAFANDGILLGPVLEEFKLKREELTSALFLLYREALAAKGLQTFDRPHPIALTVQGGIGTASEADFLLQYYHVDRTGWGTPFLFCPEATTVDDTTLSQLCRAGENDVILSNNSPLGVRFNYLKGTSAGVEKQERIGRGSPGSPCTEKHLVSNVEFTKRPVCTASRTYQRHKIQALEKQSLPHDEYNRQYQEIVAKECLCIGLSNSALTKYSLPYINDSAAVTICPGPNVAYFNKIVSLKTMTDHIYGRANLLAGTSRPHMFIKELDLNIDLLCKEEMTKWKGDIKQASTLRKYCLNLLNGIEYYKAIAGKIFENNKDEELPFIEALEQRANELQKVSNVLSSVNTVQ